MTAHPPRPSLAFSSEPSEPSEQSVRDPHLSGSRRLARLSKSRVQAGHQCPLRLWNDRFEPGLAEPPDEQMQFILDRGTRIGELAHQRYGGGLLIDAGHAETKRALTDTRAALRNGAAPSIYEAAIEHRNVLARVDILERVSAAGKRSDAKSADARRAARWDLIEVKSGTRAKDVYVRDLAIQVWIARGAGLRIRRAGLLLLNRDYVYDGERLDLEQLFRFEDLTAEVDAMHAKIETLVESLQSMLMQSSAPVILPGEQCETPYACPYLSHCTADREVLPHPVSDLPRIHARKRAELLEQGIEQIHEIPPSFPLNPLQTRVRDCITREREYVGPELREQLESIVYPVHHLDFETFMPGIPLYAGTRPYDPVPFQYSLHIEERSEDEGAGSPSGTLRHLEYLHPGRGAPYQALAERLVEDLGTRGSICVYTDYEARMIRLLAEHVPEKRAALLALIDRIWDLHPVIRANYYHPEFHGSFSIKSITPVLAPMLSYTALEIGDGMAAANTFEASLSMSDGDERDLILENLRVYCETDTLAMVELRKALGSLARASYP